MTLMYNRRPGKEHYGCLVTLLSECGNLDEAIKVILNMPFEPDAKMLESLLTACKEQNQIELEEYVLACLLQLEPAWQYCKLCSNFECVCIVWKVDKALEWRNLMKQQGWNKNPGCSWIEIGTESHAFVASDRLHPQE